MTAGAIAALAEARRDLGLDTSEAELIRAGENTLYRLPGGLVARVTREGQEDAARKEVRVSRWLIGHGVPVVEAIDALDQPVVAGDRAVTFWRDLGTHRPGNLSELAELLRRVHALPLPGFELGPLTPFVRFRDRLAAATWLPPDDLRWLYERGHDLQERYDARQIKQEPHVIHGDAWTGNVAVTGHGPVLLDLERFAIGPPEWDLVGVAVDFTTFGILSAKEWAGFCESYGQDVTTSEVFELFRDIRELRKVTFAIQMADHRPDIAEQARFRLACLQGKHGPRPWGWTEVP